MGLSTATEFDQKVQVFFFRSRDHFARVEAENICGLRRILTLGGLMDA